MRGIKNTTASLKLQLKDLRRDTRQHPQELQSPVRAAMAGNEKRSSSG